MMWPIGAPVVAAVGKDPAHMSRDTFPWSEETALARRLVLRASTVMQNAFAISPASTRPTP